MPAPPAPSWIDYDYAVLRLVPSVHRCAFQNVGVVLHARTARFLNLRLVDVPDGLDPLCQTLDADLVARFLTAYARIGEGGPAAAPIGLLPPSERFHWLTAPRSAVLQPSAVHAGRTRDPAATLDALFAEHVAPA